MGKFSKYNQDVLLTVAAFCMVVGIGATAWWATVNMIAAVNKALSTTPSTSDRLEIDLEGAKKILSAHGLTQ